MSGNFPFHDGATNNIPFDVDTIMSDSFGTSTFVAGFTGQVFCCQYGTYLVQLQLQVNTNPTQMRADIFCQSGNIVEQTELVTYAPVFSNQFINGIFNSDHSSAESRVIGTPQAFPLVIRCSLTVNGGGDGAVLASGTSLLVQQLNSYQLP